MTAERGPHPAASPFDKRVSQKLGVSAFEVYQVELPPGAETVRHTHLADQVEDVYAFIRGEGWVVVDDEHVPVRPGQFVAVTVETPGRSEPATTVLPSSHSAPHRAELGNRACRR